MADLMNKTVGTPAGDAPVIPVIILSLGAYLTWFGVHYWRTDTAWPSDPVKAVLTGKPIPEPDRSSGQDAIKNIVTGDAGGTVTETGSAVGHSPGAGPTAKVLTKDQIKALWIGNGGSASTANLAAAVALAESSGRTGPDVNTHNPDGGTNVGLFQLDTKGAGAGHSVSELQDPATNARVTIMKSANGTNWNAWETWHTGAYKKYL